MTNVTLKASATNFAYEKAPTNLYWNKTGYLLLRNGAGVRSRAYLWFSLPFTRGVKVRSAKVRVRTRALGAYTGRTVTLRGLSRGLNFSKLTWNAQPAEVFYGSAVSVACATVQPENTVLEFDVTQHMQLVSDGQAWYGFRLETNDTGPVYLQSNLMGASVRAELVVEWSDAPLKPDRLSPSGATAVGRPSPVLRFDFEDYSANRDLAGFQVETQTGGTSWGVGGTQWSSGIISSDQPQLDLSGFPTFPVPTQDQRVFWRVNVKDGAGLWSGWSRVVDWYYISEPVVKLVNPDATGVVSDNTPSIDWTYTSARGYPQTAFRVGLYRLITRQGLSSGQWAPVYASGKIAGAATSWTPPKALGVNGTYKCVVDVFDDRHREPTPGDPGYGKTEQVFQYKYSATVAPATTGSWSEVDRTPSITLNWKRTTQPDSWVILRDGEAFARYSGAALSKGGDNYSIRDLMPAPRVPHVYSVIAVQNKVSSNPLYITAKSTPLGTWIGAPDGSNMLCIVQDKEREVAFTESTAVHYVPGSQAPVVIYNGSRGYEGTLKGILRKIPQIPDKSAVDWKKIALAIKEEVGIQYQVVWGDESFPAVLADIQVARSATMPDTYNFSCKFYQQKDFNYDDPEV